MFKKYVLLLVSLTLVGVGLFAGGQRDGRDQAGDGGFVASMATDTGGLGDQSFNDGVYGGLEMARDLHGIEIRVVESNQQTDYIPNLGGLAEDGSNIVFAVGFLMADAVHETARNNADTFFAGIDIVVDSSSAPNNLLGILFREEESGYLAGVLSGLLTSEYASASPKLNDDNVLGVVLGLLIPPVEKFEVGFKAGVHKYNPEAEVISIVAGDFTDTAKGKEAALAMIDRGADVVFHAAGLTGVGAINAAQERNVFAIGVDVDQSALAPDTVLTSAIKRLTPATYLAIKSALDGDFEGGQSLALGIDDDATGLAPFGRFDNVVPQAVKDIIDDEISEMKAGRVEIPTTRAEAEALGID